MLCDENGCFGGDDDEALLRELRRKGLLERFDGLVLVGLGPPAMVVFVRRGVLRWPRARQSDVVEAVEACRKRAGAVSQRRRLDAERSGAGRCQARALRATLGVKQLRNVVMPGSDFGGCQRAGQARAQAGDWGGARQQKRDAHVENKEATRCSERRRGWAGEWARRGLGLRCEACAGGGRWHGQI